jgi:ABC-type multidrug transport system fused ATPase/permease subunit
MSVSSSKNSLWKYLWLKSEALLITFILINLTITAVIGYLTPRLIAEFYQALKSQESFREYLLLLGGLFIFEYFNRFIYQVCTHRYIQLLLMDIRKRSFSLWLKAPFKKHAHNKADDYPLGEVLARLMNDTDSVREVVSSNAFGFFIDIIFIVASLISFLRLNTTTGIGLIVAQIAACILLVKGSQFMAKIFMEVRRITGLMARVVTDITSGLKELFYSPNDRYASRRGEKIFEEFLDKQLHANIWDAGYYSAAESLYPILIALVMIMVPYSGIVEVAILAALIDLVQKSITPIKDIASKISVLQRAKTGLIRLQQFDHSFSQDHFERKDFTDLEVEKFSFKLDKFQYDQGFKLAAINFELKRGEILGILGESGCGKSTLLKLLSGQYHPFQGEMIIDKQRIDATRELELRSFSSYVSLISQDSHVFTEDVKFNITLGYVGEFEEFWELAKNNIPYLVRWNLNPEDKILPQQLSMGQKQLISGLRALFLKKPIILMDEISSGLDSELELALRDLISFFQSRSITIIVTHRLETISQANYLLLLENGKVLFQGSPKTMRNIPQYMAFLDHLK